MEIQRNHIKASQINLYNLYKVSSKAPTIWAAISMLLINIVKKLNGGIKSISPITHERLHFASFLFVNDSMLLECKLGAVKEQTKERL